MAAPKTNNFVQCVINGVASACTATLENTLNYAIPSAGATIQTLLDNTSLSWAARSDDLIENGKIVYYTGNTVSNTSGAVTLNLDTRIEKGSIARTLLVGCINSVDTNATNCDITIDDEPEHQMAFFKAVPIGSYVSVTLPDGMNPDNEIYIRADGNPFNQYNEQDRAYKNLRYGDLIDGQTITMQLNEYYPE
jgi:hypothetical protein